MVKLQSEGKNDSSFQGLWRIVPQCSQRILLCGGMLENFVVKIQPASLSVCGAMCRRMFQALGRNSKPLY
eukprot:scaffold9544_cov97-Cylindrotheca_fusiformis.AAC.4